MQAQCGVAIVGREKAAFKPLNAYLLMAELETDDNWEILHETQSLESWARKEIHGKIGYDPILTPISILWRWSGLIIVIYEQFSKTLKELVPIKENLIDMVAEDPKPKTPLSQLWVLKQEFSGMNLHDKMQYLRMKMKEHSCDCYVLTALDEIAWLLNSILYAELKLIVVRGNDMACNPLFYSFLVLLPEESFFFVEESRLNWPVLVHCRGITDIRLLHIQRHTEVFVIVFPIRHSIIFSHLMLRHLDDGG